MEHGNWATHIGRQSGGRRIEAQQYRVGRPWSGWVGTNVALVQLGLPSINIVESETAKKRSKAKTLFVGLVGRGEPGGRVYMRIVGVTERWIPVNEHGEWKIQLGRMVVIGEHFEIEVYQVKDGYADSRRAIYGLANGRRKEGLLGVELIERIPVFLRVQ